MPLVDIDRLSREPDSKDKGRAILLAMTVIVILFTVTFFFYT